MTLIGDGKIRIRDKHPGSATLILNLLTAAISYETLCIGGDPEVHPGEEEGVREEACRVRAAEGGRDGGVQGGGGRRERGTAQEV